MLILDLLAERVRSRGQHPFALHAGRSLSYAELDRLTNRAARALLALGVRKGDRVSVAMRNSIEYLVAAFGILKAGAVYNPVNAALGPAELSYIFGHAEPRVILTDAGNLASLQSPKLTLPSSTQVALFEGEGPISPAPFPRREGGALHIKSGELGIVIPANAGIHDPTPPPHLDTRVRGYDGPTEPTSCAKPEGGEAVSFDRLLADAADESCGVTLRSDDPSTLLYTSGTTGNPKGVLFHHGSTGAAGHHFLDTLGIIADDVILAVTPLFHGNAWGAVVTALQAGGTVAYPKAFRASEFWPLVQETRATVLYTLGTILAILLTQPPSAAERRSKLRVILGLGSASIRDRVIERFGVQHVAECFGATDAGVVTITPLGAAPREGSAGPPVPGVTLRIVDDQDTPLPVRQVGEITVHSPHCMAEYLRDPEQTAQTLRDGWFYTGDLGYLDEEGWLYFVDRKKDVIRRGGENMSSALIEKTLREHPRVVEAAVIGVPDPVLGQEVKAFIVANGPVTEEELRQFAAERLARFQVPRLWEFRTSLPKTPTQRIEKYKLRQEAGGGKPMLG